MPPCRRGAHIFFLLFSLTLHVAVQGEGIPLSGTASSGSLCQKRIALLEPIWEKDPKSIAPRGMELAACYVQDLRYDDAWSVLQTLHQLLPLSDFAQAAASLTLQVAQVSRRYEEGEKLLQELWSAGLFRKEHLEVALSLSEAKGDYVEALKWLRRGESRGLFPRDGWERVGDYSRFLGRREAAVLSYFAALTHQPEQQRRILQKLSLFPDALLQKEGMVYLKREYSLPVLRFLAGKYTSFQSFLEQLGVLLQVPTALRVNILYQVARERGGDFYCQGVSTLARVYGSLFAQPLSFSDYRMCHPKENWQALCQKKLSLLDGGRCQILSGHFKAGEETLKKFVFEHPEESSALDALEVLFFLKRDKKAAAALAFYQMGEAKEAERLLSPPDSPEALALLLRFYAEEGEFEKGESVYRAHPEFQNQGAPQYDYALLQYRKGNREWRTLLLELIQEHPNSDSADKARRFLDLHP